METNYMIENIRILVHIHYSFNSELKQFVRDYTLQLSDINNNKFDILVYAIENDASYPLVEWIILNCHYKTLNFIIKNVKEDKKSIPLLAALKQNKFKIANLLIHYGADLQYIPPFLLAPILNNKNLKYVYMKDLPITVTLINQIVKRGKRNNNHDLLQQVFHYYFLDNTFILKLLSLYKNRIPIFNTQLNHLLTKEQNKINQKDDQGNTLLTCAILNENESLTKYLIDEQADPNLINGNGKTPLTIAIENYNRDMARYLIDHGADISMENGNGYTPLTMATENFYIEMIGYLIDHGADIDGIDGNHNTPLTAAIKNDDDDLVEYLINRGAYINKMDGHGNTPLTTAIQDYLYFGTVKYLIDRDADIHSRDGHGNTPLTIAVKTSGLFTVILTG